MKLKMVQTHIAVFTPDGGGQTGHFLREHQFDLFLEGQFVRVRMKDKKDGHVYEIPLSNVAILQRAPAEPANDTTPQVKK